MLIAGEMTMRIPKTIVRRKAQQYNDDTRAWFFGQPERDALLISVKVSPKHDQEAPSVADDDVQKKPLEPYRHGAGEGQKGSGELLSNGQPCHQWVWTENDKIIVVQVLVAPWAYERWKFKAAEIADGVQMISTQH